MNNPSDKLSDDVRLRALIGRRRRFNVILSAIVVIFYSGLILLIAFRPGWLAPAVHPEGAVTTGLLWSFLYVVLTFVVMGLYVWRRTGEKDSHLHETATPPEK